MDWGLKRRIDERDSREERAASPLVGIILLFGMVFVAAAVLAVTGVTLIDALESNAMEQQGVNELNELDHTLRTQGFDPDVTRSVVLSGEVGEYELIEDGSVSITAKGQFGGEETVVNSLPLRTIVLEAQDGHTVAYQAGGVFVGQGEGSSVRSAPALTYRTVTTDGTESKQLSFSVVDLQGDVGAGENTVETNASTRSRESLEDIRYVSGVTIAVENTTYHHAWNAFLTNEFGADAVTHYEANRTVVVDAAIDHDRPFTDFVDVYPTIYGGLHAESNTPVIFGPNADLTVDGYDSRNGTYDATRDGDDLVTVDTDTRLQLDTNAEVAGIPISNVDVQAQPGATVTPFAFYADEDTSPTDTDVLTAQLTQPFDSIEPITTEIEDQAIDLLSEEGGSLPDDPGQGLYYSANDVTISNETIDTGNGSEGVHIGVDGDLSMDDVTVTGSGQIHIYVTGDVDIQDVSVPNDRASALWIYGTEDAEVTISGTVQGVVYAPGSDTLTIEDGATVYGSVVGGNPGSGGAVGNQGIGNDVEVHFDRSLRSALPLQEEDLDQEWNETHPNELDVAFVLDSTGSMEESDPDDLIKPATQNAIGMLNNEYHRAGVFEFDTSGRTLHPISHDLDAVNASIEANEEGSTNISTGIEHTLDEFETDEGAGREKHMILMTDGENSPGLCFPPFGSCNDKEKADNATIQQAHRAAANNVTIWTIAFSENADSDLMNQVATITGGESATVEEASDIEDVMEQFLAEAIDEEEELVLEVNLEYEANPRANHEAFDVQTFTFEIEDG